jgi:hypothetical protein
VFQLKGCPKCRGALREESDRYGTYALCIHCGYLENYLVEPSASALPRLEQMEQIVSPISRPRSPCVGGSHGARPKAGKRRATLSPWTLWN